MILSPISEHTIFYRQERQEFIESQNSILIDLKSETVDGLDNILKRVKCARNSLKTTPPHAEPASVVVALTGGAATTTLDWTQKYVPEDDF